MGKSGEKRKGRRHLPKVGTATNRDAMHRDEQQEIGHNSLIGLAVGIAVILLIAGAFWLFHR